MKANRPKKSAGFWTTFFLIDPEAAASAFAPVGLGPISPVHVIN